MKQDFQDFQDEEENVGERKSLILFIVFNRVNPAQDLGFRIKPRVSSSCSSWSKIFKIHKIFRI